MTDKTLDEGVVPVRPSLGHVYTMLAARIPQPWKRNDVMEDYCRWLQIRGIAYQDDDGEPTQATAIPEVMDAFASGYTLRGER